ncbi:MAG: hypothetical protein N2487_01165 [Verrucomicrobiae bacterium]|nr:hypothetical protein [Verrucomicrobiae bacterium]
MKDESKLVQALVILIFAFSIRWNGFSADWHQKLYNGWGDYWRCRYVLTLTNSSGVKFEGTPFEVVIDTNGLNLVGESAEAIRVCDEDGVELLFGILTTRGDWISRGKIPTNSKLIIPATVHTNSGAKLFVYFRNPSAWAIPDFWEIKTDILNGDMESGEGDSPSGWTHDMPDATHKTFWTAENAHSGKMCLKTVVDNGAAPSWISTRQSNIRVYPGVKYRFRGFVRARNVKG